LSGGTQEKGEKRERGRERRWRKDERMNEE